MKEIRILSATGILGSGFKEETLKRAMAREPHFIGADSGSTDPGHTTSARATRCSRTPPTSATCGSCCSRDGARRCRSSSAPRARPAAIRNSSASSASRSEIAREEKLGFKLAAIHSEQDKGYLKRKMREGKITPLANAPEFNEAVIDRSAHIVGMAGIEPFVEALEQRRRCRYRRTLERHLDLLGDAGHARLNPATVWHAAKILECGAACVVQRKYPDCNFAIVRDDHFIVEPPNPEYRCDPDSVASHNLYENSTPYELVEPAGVLNTYSAQIRSDFRPRGEGVGQHVQARRALHDQARRRGARGLPGDHRRQRARSDHPEAARFVARGPDEGGEGPYRGGIRPRHRREVPPRRARVREERDDGRARTGDARSATKSACSFR